MNALQVFVRNFQTQDRGNRINDSLQTMGFCLKECIDGDHDTLGGIIETHITPIDELTTDDLDEIRQTVAAESSIFIQFRRYVLKEEGECRQDELRLLASKRDGESD